MERRVELKTFRVIKICPKCRQGEMTPSGMIYTSLPSKYEHICNCCGHRETYNITYPAIEYEQVEEKKEDLEDD